MTAEIQPSYGSVWNWATTTSPEKYLRWVLCLNQGPSAFTGNSHLCGFPLQTRCQELEIPNLVAAKKEGTQELQNQTLAWPARKKERRNRPPVRLISGDLVFIGDVSVSVWMIRKKKKKTELIREQNRDEDGGLRIWRRSGGRGKKKMKSTNETAKRTGPRLWKGLSLDYRDLLISN